MDIFFPLCVIKVYPLATLALFTLSGLFKVSDFAVALLCPSGTITVRSDIFDNLSASLRSPLLYGPSSFVRHILYK